jgi:hypothetical protein
MFRQMKTQLTTLDSLIERVEALERLFAARNRATVIETTELRLIDTAGKAKAVLSVDDHGPFLTFPDKNGEIQTESLPLVTWEGSTIRARASLWSLK